MNEAQAAVELARALTENERLRKELKDCGRALKREEVLRQRVEELEREKETIPFAVLDMTPDKFIVMKKDAERWRESQELGMVSWDDILEAIGDWGGPEHECFNLAIRKIKQQQDAAMEADK